jgi:hypothetical protein
MKTAEENIFEYCKNKPKKSYFSQEPLEFFNLAPQNFGDNAQIYLRLQNLHVKVRPKKSSPGNKNKIGSVTDWLTEKKSWLISRDISIFD